MFELSAINVIVFSFITGALKLDFTGTPPIAILILSNCFLESVSRGRFLLKVIIIEEFLLTVGFDVFVTGLKSVTLRRGAHTALIWVGASSVVFSRTSAVVLIFFGSSIYMIEES